MRAPFQSASSKTSPRFENDVDEIRVYFREQFPNDGTASEEQQGCQEELLLRLVPWGEGGQGGGRDAWCHNVPAGAGTASGTFQGHAAGERH